MKTDIILAGVGGQGILTIAAAIGFATLSEKMFVKQSELHGMSQRGGAVQSHLRLSDQPVASDLIPMGCADLILSVEPMESLRYLPYLNPGGCLVTNSVPYLNIPNYPEEKTIHDAVKSLPNYIWINADEIARECGSIKSSNIVMLGAASRFINLPFSALQEGVRQVFGRKGDEIVTMNLKALEAGQQAAALKP
ncbi:MAG: indolepyruvate oxidoreductase subunit beta [Bacteroidales bacterium]|nr:indolepyruvate oxidoreductase subunit beta [Bacteroidales bacterium]